MRVYRFMGADEAMRLCAYPTLSFLADNGLSKSSPVIPLEAKSEINRMHQFIKK